MMTDDFLDGFKDDEQAKASYLNYGRVEDESDLGAPFQSVLWGVNREGERFGSEYLVNFPAEVYWASILWDSASAYLIQGDEGIAAGEFSSLTLALVRFADAHRVYCPWIMESEVGLPNVSEQDRKRGLWDLQRLEAMADHRSTAVYRGHGKIQLPGGRFVSVQGKSNIDVLERLVSERACTTAELKQVSSNPARAVGHIRTLAGDRWITTPTETSDGLYATTIIDGRVTGMNT